MAESEFEPAILKLMLKSLKLSFRIIAPWKEAAGRHSSSAGFGMLWLSDCPTGSPATGGEVIMCPSKEENVPGMLAECEGITTDIAVLKQVSGHQLCHDAVSQYTLAAWSKELGGFCCFTWYIQEHRQKSKW